jgi:hypothetical protein
MNRKLGRTNNNMEALICVGRDGIKHTFYVDYKLIGSPAVQTCNFYVYRSSPPIPEDEWFDLTVVRFDPQTFMVTMMQSNYKEWFSAKGIPEAIIPYAAGILKCHIVSSSNKKNAGEYRTPPATKAWERLRNKALADYDAENDRYALR